MKFKKESKEVLYNTSKFLLIDKKKYKYLKNLMKKNKKKIVRLCVHKSKKDLIHQMLIIHPKNYYVPPHMHNREESMLILKGSVDVVVFDRSKKIKKIIKMGDLNSGKTFYYNLPKNTLHTLIIKSNFLFFRDYSRTIQKKKYAKI